MIRSNAMRHHMIVLLTTCLILSFPACADDEVSTSETPPAPPEKPTGEALELAKSNNTFAWDLYGRLSDAEGNLFFSPSSIHAALTMTLAGAHGETAEQMYEALALPMEVQNVLGRPGRETQVHPEMLPPARWPNEWLHGGYANLLANLAAPEDGGYELQVANALWGQEGYPWRDDFLTLLKSSYSAGLEQVDFAGDTEAPRQAINTWVEAQTNEKIKDLLAKGTLGPLTKLVLTNAIYFKGKWDQPFKAEHTHDEPFHLTADKTVDVPMMHQNKRFAYTETELAQLLSLPYGGKDVSMVVVLPKAVDGLAAVEQDVIANGLDEPLSQLRKTKVNVALPKFQMTWDQELSKVLVAMGMTDAFDSSKADFSGMSDQARQDQLHIGLVVHKAFVGVDEEGTEAAAATAVAVRTTAMPSPPKEFRADHPFLFVIRHDKTGAILFVGRVANPADDQ